MGGKKKCKKGYHVVPRWDSDWTEKGIIWSGICSECGEVQKSKDAPIETKGGHTESNPIITKGGEVRWRHKNPTVEIANPT